MLDLILSQLANGVALGFIYVLIAIGLSIIFGLLGIVNFAHGVFFTLGAYLALSLQRRFGWPAVILAPFGVAAVGMVVEVTLIRRLYGKDPAVQPDHDLRPGAADRGGDPAAMGLGRAALLAARLPEGVRRVRPGAAHPLTASA